MSNSPESYSYEHGSGAGIHHLRNDRSSRLRRRSLRVSLLPPESEDITLQSIDEEDLPEDQRTFNPSSFSPLPSVHELDANDESDDSLGDNPPSSQRSQASSPPPSSASSVRPTPTRSVKKSKSKGGKKKKKSQVPAVESLQGLGPIPVRTDDEQPHVFGSIRTNGSHSHEKPSSRVWKYTYGLKSDIQPRAYTLDNVPICKEKPRNKDGIEYIGCRICNNPPAGEKQSP